MTQPWLSLSVICRDAEKTIPTLLSSIHGIFDEVVIVDTGSRDRTKKIVEEHFGLPPQNDWATTKILKHDSAPDGNLKLTLSEFKWVDDFAAARQRSFELASAKWRMYLDCDDDASDFQKKFRPTLKRTEEKHPETNCISVKYDYVPNEMAQDTIRIVRWKDGWAWQDPVHEHLVRTNPNSGRVISKYTDVWVKHRPAEPQKHANASFARNVQIAEKAYREAVRPEKKGLWAYYLANYAFEVGELDQARRLYREMADTLGRNNITCEGLCRWARLEMKQGNYEKAMDLAGEAMAKAPELPDGLATMGVAQTLAGAPYRAAGLFDLLKAHPRPPLETQHDAVWLDGMTNAYAAQAYYRIGRVSDADAALKSIPEGLQVNPEVALASRPTQVSLAKTDGFDRLKGLWEYLIWDTEPLKAKRLLEEFCPAALSDSPQVQDLIRRSVPKLAHMKDWASYQRAYAAIPELPYHVPKEHHAWTLTRGRARMVRQWAENLPFDGPPVEVLVIGVQDGIIESAMLAANPRIRLTACDVAPQASVGINEMISKFPGRVSTHQLKEDHFDWFPPGSRFDAIILFEVIEHVPDLPRCPGDEHALRVIREHLKPDGQFFLSTPIASHWVEHYLSALDDPRPWWHVRAHNPTSLWKLFQKTGFTGSLLGLQEETLFLAKMTPAKPMISLKQIRENRMAGINFPDGLPPEFSIWVYPQRPMNEGFDPFSPKLGHCGGSEEAVIHLSAALARKGCRVTIYTDSPNRGDTLFVHEGVQWRGHDEFDVGSLKGTLLVWRAPQMASVFKKQNPRARVLNWLHDSNYSVQGGEKPDYDGADGTIVLSQFHGEAIRQLDGYNGPFIQCSNGIDPREFPEPDESKRNPHAAIYAAAPERGLELLLEAWLTIRAAVPDATLNVYYSWEMTEKMLKQRPNAELTDLLQRLRTAFHTMKDHGVTYHGGVSHKVLHEAYRTSSVWAFPPERFNEISGISALKAMASGCWPVVIPTGALPETCPFGVHVSLNPDRPTLIAKYAEAVIASMNNERFVGRQTMRAWALEQRWDKSADQFIAAAQAKNERVTIFAGGFGRRFSAAGSADGKPLGGSEEAVIAMAKALSEAGKQVVVYAPLADRSQMTTNLARAGELGAAIGNGNVATWLDASTFDPAGPHGTLLAWRCPARVPGFKGNGYPVILWLMDPHYRAAAYDYAEADDVVFLTQAHKKIIEGEDGFDGGGSVVHVGIPELPALGSIKRDPNAVMWATSPDRGLLEFLKETWPAVLKEVKDATLHIFYGLEPLELNGKKDLAEAIRAEILKINTANGVMHGDPESARVCYHGGVPDGHLYEWYQRCSIFAYRCRDFEETQSISVCKALALGCWPVVNDRGCLPEVVGGVYGAVATDEGYTELLIRTLKSQPGDDVRRLMATDARSEFSTATMVEEMLKVIAGVQ